jgi:hypothetical protein
MASEYKYVPNTSVRVCSATFVNEQDLPDGQKLFKCSQCRECYYQSKQHQRMHWKIHKLSCCSIFNDESIEGGAFRFESIQHICQAIEASMNDWDSNTPPSTKGRRILVYAMQQLRRWFLEEEEDRFFPSEEVAGLLSSTFTRAFRRLALPGHRRQAELIWEIPGFACHFLDEELFLSPMMKDLKSKGIKHEHRDLEYQRTYQEILDTERRLGPGFHLSPLYIALIETVLLTSSGSIDSPNGKIRLRPGTLTAAVIRLAFRLCCDAYVRLSWPDSNADESKPEEQPLVTRERHNFFFFMLKGTLFEHRMGFFDQFIKWNEVLPGTSLYHFLTALICQHSFSFGLSKDHLKDITRVIFRSIDTMTFSQTQGPWKALTVAERLDLTESILHWHVDPQFEDFAGALLRYVAVGHTRSMLQMHRLTELKLKSDTISSSEYESLQHMYEFLSKSIQGNLKHVLDKGIIQEYAKLVEHEHQSKYPADPPATFPEELLSAIGSFLLESSCISEGDAEIFIGLILGRA